MAGMFELFVDADAQFKFRLSAPDGTVMAVSRAFDDKPTAVAGITVVREYAVMGLIPDPCQASAKSSTAASAHPRLRSPTRQDQGRRSLNRCGHQAVREQDKAFGRRPDT